MSSKICLKDACASMSFMSSQSSSWFSLGFPANVSVLILDATGAIWRFRTLSHCGDVKRWTMVKEDRSSSFGEIVGSWVEMMTRAPRWRCNRMVESNDSVKVEASSEESMYLCASSNATTLPTRGSFSRKMLRQILKMLQATLDVMQGHERSTIVRAPG